MKQTKVKITKSAFEKILMDIYGFSDMTVNANSSFNEETGKRDTMRLYYFNGYHVGTWMQKGSWYYADKASVEVKAAEQAELFKDLKV